MWGKQYFFHHIPSVVVSFVKGDQAMAAVNGKSYL